MQKTPQRKERLDAKNASMQRHLNEKDALMSAIKIFERDLDLPRCHLEQSNIAHQNTMSSGSARQYAQEEMDIAHALYSIGGEPKPNFSALARNFAVPYHRLRRRFSGQPSRSTRTPAGKRLTEVQESELFDQISRSGYKNIEHFANQILERDHVGDQSPQTVNYKWCQRFARRHRLKFNGEMEFPLSI